ncbi:lysostaphin resistance A-like protein [Streptomyces tubbatahanensis]|uniref:Lysostaphin resistance A-like protein n=1 Tax=Streptomyces tubbatahanensis TaxID=2923272 RepID=A0ABY3XWF8_9ACTN|nr:CPBP family intramembrane glutamic endopeptidase [Streptomyces tubbatahanensis]UNS98603.1 lysostaphin resistance A-like protein [Streptomyces tubbatahanensis]
MPTSYDTSQVATRPRSYRSDLTLFFALAFGVSWAAWTAAFALGGPANSPAAAGVHLLGAFGPSAAALVLRVRRGRRGEAAPAHAVRFQRGTLLWTPLLMVLGAATVFLGSLLAQQAGGPTLSLERAQDAVRDAGGLAAFVGVMLIGGPLAEEPGWRGTVHPRMRASLGRYLTALVLGVVWSVWHLPLFFLDGTVQHELGLGSPSGILFAAGVVPMAMLIGYAYERGGVVAAIAVHLALNVTMVLLDVHIPETLAMALGLQALVAGLLLTFAPAPSPTLPRTPETDVAADATPQPTMRLRAPRPAHAAANETA